MKNKLIRYKFKNALLVSVLLGCIIGVSDALSVRALGQFQTEGGWYCPVSSVIVGGNTCTASGCRDASQVPGEAIWVCDYSGEQCPPLSGCSSSGDS